jgi:hypothetical protein
VATLEQLDNWGSMDSIDSFGTLEQLDNLNLQQPTASVSFVAAATSAVLRLRPFQAAVTGAASVAAYASFIARFAASVSAAVTTSAAVLRIRTFDASAAIASTTSGAFYRIRGMLSAVSAAVTATSENAVTFVMLAAPDMRMTVSGVPHVMGDRWSVVGGEGETWRVINPFPATLEDLDQLGSMDQLDYYGTLEVLDDLSEIIPNTTWTTVSTGSERWAVK